LRLRVVRLAAKVREREDDVELIRGATLVRITSF
jgi:hypothetical protein